jgi:hypothetical protein
MNVQAETRLIGFVPVFALMLFGPAVALVYLVYSFGFWLDRKVGHWPWWWYLASPYLVVFAVLNTLHNWTVCTVLFREWPREFFTTSRLKRHKASPDPWRRELADMMGGFLNSQDGGHY